MAATQGYALQSCYRVRAHEDEEVEGGKRRGEIQAGEQRRQVVVVVKEASFTLPTCEHNVPALPEVRR